MMKVAVDCEMTGLHQNTTLISVGLVAEDGRYFYAELLDYDQTQVDDWIKENVISNLKFPKPEEGEMSYCCAMKHGTPASFYDSYSIEVQGETERIRGEIRQWLRQFEQVEWVTDCGHYDLVLLFDLIAGNALKLPKHITPTGYDLNQALMVYYDCETQEEAFQLSRDLLCDYIGAKLPKKQKHNALYDAHVIMEIYQFLHEEKDIY